MKFLIALLVGAASAFAFQPYALWPLMPIAFALLCELIARAPRLRSAIGLGYAFSVGQFCVGLNWIATAFTYQAAMPAWLGWVAVFLLSLYLAVYPMLAAGLAWNFGRERRIALVLALSGAWAICEWLRGTMFTGFAWNPVGVSLVDTPWRSTLPTIGTYGLTMLVVLGGGGLWLLARREWRLGAWVAAALVILLFLPQEKSPDMNGLRVIDLPESPPQPTLGGVSVHQPTWPSPAPPQPTPGGVSIRIPTQPLPPPPATPPAPRPMPAGTEVDPGFRLGAGYSNIRIVQPNIGQQDKWRDGFGAIAARRLAQLSEQPSAQPPTLMLWPEAAVTEPLLDERIGAAPTIDAERRGVVQAMAGSHYLLTGGLGLRSSDGNRVDGAVNSVFALDSAGRLVARYDKAHLVPYGEYLPMRPILSAIGLSRLAPGDLDFAAGPGPRTIVLPGWGKVGIQLCYEIIFSGEVVDPAHRPDFIFNPSNDAWFGRWGPPQHLAQARLRAAEEGLAVIRATPTGISAVVDPAGTIIKSLPWRTAGVIDAQLPPPFRPTLFARLSNVIPLTLGFLLLGIAIALGRRRSYRAHI